MIKEGLLGTAEEIDRKISAKMIFWQGLATSVDALSVGFMIEEIDGATAFLCSLVIGAVTFVICLSGIVLGKKFGMKFSDKATLLGGLILFGIGLKMLMTGLFAANLFSF